MSYDFHNSVYTHMYNEWMDDGNNEWMNGCIIKYRVNEWMDDGWMNGWKHM